MIYNRDPSASSLGTNILTIVFRQICFKIYKMITREYLYDTTVKALPFGLAKPICPFLNQLASDYLERTFLRYCSTR
jgi:hypothetical protein